MNFLWSDLVGVVLAVAAAIAVLLLIERFGKR